MRLVLCFILLFSASLLTANPLYTTKEPDIRAAYIVTNELNADEVLQEMARKEARGDVGIGVSGFYNLRLFAARSKSVTRWIIVDPAPEVQAFWHLAKEVFQTSDNLLSAFETLSEALTCNRGHYYSPKFQLINGLEGHSDFCQWLHTQLSKARREFESLPDCDFACLRDLTARISLFPTDLANEQAVQSLIAHLEAQGLRVDTLYISNIDLCLPQAAVEGFRALTQRLRRQHEEKPAYLIEAHGRHGKDGIARSDTRVSQRIYDQ